MASSYIVGQVVERAVELDLVDAETAVAAVDPQAWDETLDYFGEPDSGGALSLLDTLGIRYTTDYKTFRGDCTDGGMLETYRYELQLIAGCTRGLLTITNVELADDQDGYHRLRFRCNGEAQEWFIDHSEDERLQTQLVFALDLTDLRPKNSSRLWSYPEPVDEDVASDAVFGDPVALNLFGAPYGLTFTPYQGASS